jgi:hypothetical protein
MRVVRVSLLALLAWLAGGRALAHEGGAHAKGTVKEISADRLVLATTAGTEVSVALVSGTQIVRGRHAIAVTDVHPGERAVVHASKRGDRLEATEVMLADPK